MILASFVFRWRLILLLVTAFCVQGCVDKEPLADVFISNVTVIDAVNGVRENQDVTIQDGRITALAPHQADGKGIADIVIDGDGQYLIPGLWDAHVHLTFTPDLGHEVFFPLSIAHGVTSLRDTGGHIDALRPAREAAAADPLAPDLFVSGPLIDGPLRVYAGQGPFNPDISVGIASPEEAREMVDRLIAADVDFIKAYEMLSEPTFLALVEYATEQGLPVSAHVPLSMTAGRAAEAGIGDMQHLRNLELSCGDRVEALQLERQNMLDNAEDPDPAALRRDIHQLQRSRVISNLSAVSCDDMIGSLARASVAQTPTLTISRFQTHGLYGDEAYRQSFDYLPESIAVAWKERSMRFASPTTQPAALAFDEWLIGMIPQLVDADVPIMAGTDAPIGFLTPGASLHQELFMLVDAGMTPLGAIGAATIEPARFFGLEDKRGLIAPGMDADLVLLSEDPVADIRAIQAIMIVVKGGRVVDRGALNELIANLQGNELE